MFKYLLTFLDPTHPPSGERRGGDRRRDDRIRTWIHRGWMAVLTVMWVWIAVSLHREIQRGNATRYQGTKQRCELVQTLITALIHDFQVPPHAPAVIRLRRNLAGCLVLERRAKGDRG